MASGHTRLQGRNSTGSQFDVQHTTTDSPLLPAENLRSLQQIDPSLVDWVIKQTEIEAAYRRTQDARINIFVMIERVSGVVAGTLVSVFGLGVAGYVAMAGHEVAAAAIGGSTLATIVAVLVTKTKKQSTTAVTAPQEAKPKKRR